MSKNEQKYHQPTAHVTKNDMCGLVASGWKMGIEPTLDFTRSRTTTWSASVTGYIHHLSYSVGVTGIEPVIWTFTESSPPKDHAHFFIAEGSPHDEHTSQGTIGFQDRDQTDPSFTFRFCAPGTIWTYIAISEGFTDPWFHPLTIVCILDVGIRFERMCRFSQLFKLLSNLH